MSLSIYGVAPGVQLVVARIPGEQPPAPLPFMHGFTVVPLVQLVLAEAPELHLFGWLAN